MKLVLFLVFCFSNNLVSCQRSHAMDSNRDFNPRMDLGSLDAAYPAVTTSPDPFSSNAVKDADFDALCDFITFTERSAHEETIDLTFEDDSYTAYSDLPKQYFIQKIEKAYTILRADQLEKMKRNS
ncbi:MAG: hypothetical protein V4482_00295 [Pseudomonadota bacterium]